MGAGKSTVGARIAERTARPFVDLDRLIERRHGPIPELFERGESEFRQIEEGMLAEALAGPESVIALGGGAVLSPLNRERLRAGAFTVYLDVGVETAWERVQGSERPLARREDDFRKLYESRQQTYAETADAIAEDEDDVLLASLGISLDARRERARPRGDPRRRAGRRAAPGAARRPGPPPSGRRTGEVPCRRRAALERAVDRP